MLNDKFLVCILVLHSICLKFLTSMMFTVPHNLISFVKLIYVLPYLQLILIIIIHNLVSTNRSPYSLETSLTSYSIFKYHEPLININQHDHIVYASPRYV